YDIDARGRYYRTWYPAAKLPIMIVAITGANGFIGRHLCRRFAHAGWEVRPVVRADSASAEAAKFRGADVVVHAAGATRAPTTAQLVASNVDLTKRVVEEAGRSGAKRLVFISSQAAAGPAGSREAPGCEDDPH